MEDKIEELVNHALTGEKEAIDELYRIYGPKLRSAVREKLGKNLRSHMDSIDLVQSVWGDVLSEFEQFTYQGSDSFFNWIVARMVHKIETKGRFYGAKKRNPKKMHSLDSEKDKKRISIPPDSKRKSPPDTVINKERLEKLSDVLDHFSEIKRKVLVLRLKEELEFARIGEIIGKSEDATRMLFNRSLEKLVDLMKE